MDVVDHFVGRSRELSQLADLVRALADGVSAVVIVEGEQGIGKSALLRQGLLRAERAGCKVLWAAADELSQQLPLWLMSQCVGDVYDAAAERHPLIGVVPTQAGVERTLAAIDQLCAASPVVLVVEDLQWADEASMQVIHRLCLSVGQLPLLLAASWRPSAPREDLDRLRRGAAHRGGTFLALESMPEADVDLLIERLVGGKPGPEVVALARQAGGNPLYVGELIEAMVREGQIRVRGGVGELTNGHGELAVPASLEAAIGDRLAGLDDDVVAVLRQAALLGTEFTVAALEACSGRPLDELVEMLTVAVRSGVVQAVGPRPAFRHPLIRQVLYESVPAALRAAAHLKAAQALATAGVAAEQVAAQLAACSGNQDALIEAASRLWVADWIAEHAEALTYRAPQMTAQLLRDVLVRLAAEDPRREALAASLVRVAFLLAQDGEVERVGGDLVTRSADPDRAAEMAWFVAYAQDRTGRDIEAEATIAAAMDRPNLSAENTARLTALLAMVRVNVGNLDLATDTAQAALASARQAGSRFAGGYALHALSTVSYLRGDSRAALDHETTALDLIGHDPQTTDLRALLLLNQGSALDELGRPAEAQAALSSALVLAEQSGLARTAGARAFMAMGHYDLGQWDEARATIEPAIGMPGQYYLPIMVHGLIALIAVHRDDQAAAREHLAVLPEKLARNPAPSVKMNAHHALLAQALAAERAGQPGVAAEILAPCLEPAIAAQMPNRHLLLPTLARLARAIDDEHMVNAAAAAATADADDEPVPARIADAEHCRGLAERDPAGVRAAVSQIEVIGLPLKRAEALESLAVLLAADGQPALARRAAAEAQATYQRLDAAWDTRRLDQRLRPLGIRLSRSARPRPLTGWDALTPTESQVAYLVAQGKSNPEVAAELFLSRNTVQTHVSHILAKLSARSRMQIAREAMAHPSAS